MISTETVREGFYAWFDESRRRQGLTDRIEDPATIGRLAALIRNARRPRPEQDQRTARAA